MGRFISSVLTAFIYTAHIFIFIFSARDTFFLTKCCCRLIFKPSFPLLLISFIFLPSPAHPAGISFRYFTGFLALLSLCQCIKQQLLWRVGRCQKQNTTFNEEQKISWLEIWRTSMYRKRAFAGQFYPKSPRKVTGLSSFYGMVRSYT